MRKYNTEKTTRSTLSIPSYRDRSSLLVSMPPTMGNHQQLPHAGCVHVCVYASHPIMLYEICYLFKCSFSTKKKCRMNHQSCLHYVRYIATSNQPMDRLCTWSSKIGGLLGVRTVDYTQSLCTIWVHIHTHTFDRHLSHRQCQRFRRSQNRFAPKIGSNEALVRFHFTIAQLSASLVQTLLRALLTNFYLLSVLRIYIYIPSHDEWCCNETNHYYIYIHIYQLRRRVSILRYFVRVISPYACVA